MKKKSCFSSEVVWISIEKFRQNINIQPSHKYQNGSKKPLTFSLGLSIDRDVDVVVFDVILLFCISFFIFFIFFFAECFNYAIRVRDLSTLRIQKILFCCFSSEVVWISIEKSGSALKSPDRISTYNLLTNVKMDPKNLYLFPWDQASTMMLMLLFVGHVNKCRKALVNNLIKKKIYGEKKNH